MKKIFSTIQQRTTGGFTLIEMMVSSAMFITALLIIVGSLLSLETASRKARNTRVAMDNVSAAIDSMSRTMRMGTNYHCGTYSPSTIENPADCEMDNSPGEGGATTIAFEHQGGASGNPADQYIYKQQGTSILRSTDGGATWVAMTAPEITITDLKFFVGGTPIGADQAYIIMIVRGEVGSAVDTRAQFNIQTMVSQRTPNLF